jgi:hypothetical protein
MTVKEALIAFESLSEDKKKGKLAGKTYRVAVLRTKGLRMVECMVEPYRIVGVGQNPGTTWQWAALASGSKSCFDATGATSPMFARIN